MGDKQKHCKLCLSKIKDENYKLINNFMRETIAIILLKLDLTEEGLFVCSDCVPKLFAAFDFKSTCLSIENEMVGYINSEDEQVDIKEVYLKEGLYEDAVSTRMDYKKKICRLCLLSIASDSVPFTQLDQNLIDSYIPEVNWSAADEPSCICSSCSAKLYKAFDFKIECLYVENKVVSHINLEQPQTDLKIVCLNKNQGEPVIKIEDDQKICRLCLKFIDKFVLHDKIEPEFLKKCIPEVNFNITKDPVICMSCFDALYTHGNFIKTCHDMHTPGGNTFETLLLKSEVSKDETEEVNIKIEEPDIGIEGSDINKEEPDINMETSNINGVDLDTNMEEPDMIFEESCSSPDRKNLVISLKKLF